MSSSITVAFVGSSTELHADFLPEIMLDEQYEYSCALLDLHIKNVTDSEISITDGLRIDCDIVSGSYINGARNPTIHQFIASASIGIGRTFREIPQNLNYLPVKNKILRSIHISVADSKGKPLANPGAEFFCRLIIKREGIRKIN